MAQSNEDVYGKIDNDARLIKGVQIESLAKKLTVKYTNDEHKVRAIFAWITDNIAYDVNRSLKPITYTYRTGEAEAALARINAGIINKVFTDRVAVCEGYARLFKKMCNTVNIECDVVEGVARNMYSAMNSAEPHSWNAVKIDGQWQLVDATWGSGYVNNGFVKSFESFFFMAKPDRLRYTHFPNKAQWQLTDSAISKSDFFKLPLLFPKYYAYEILSITPSEGIINIENGNNNISITVISPAKRTHLTALEVEQKKGNMTMKNVASLAGETISYNAENKTYTVKNDFVIGDKSYKLNVFLGVNIIATYWISRY